VIEDWFNAKTPIRHDAKTNKTNKTNKVQIEKLSREGMARMGDR